MTPLMAGAFILLCTASASAKAVVIGDDLTSISIGRSTFFWEDKTGELTLKQVLSPRYLAAFKKSSVEAPSFGYTRSSYWFYVDLDSRLATERELILEVPYPPLDRIEVYLPAPGGAYRRAEAGESFAHGHKTRGFITFLFPLRVHPGKQRIFIRVQTNSSMLVPLKLWAPAALQVHASQVLIVHGLYVGLFVLVFIYNLFLYLSIRNTNYLYYLGYLLSTLIYQSTLEGLPQEYLWGGWPWWVNVSMPFALSASWVFGTLFAKKFLKVKDNAPRLNRVLTVALVMAIAGVIGSFFLPYKVVTVYVVIFASLTAIYIIITATVVWRRGYLPARLYLAAWVAWLSGVVLICLARLGLLPVNIVTDKGHMFGFVLNAILLSLALADRINLLKREQKQAQAQVLKLERKTAEALEAEVEAKTLDLQRKNQDLQEAYERLEEHDRLKSSFFANVSHELRTPLTLILTPLQQLLSSTDLPERVGVRLRSMQGNTQRLLRLVNQLLDFSRLESGAMELNLERVEIRSLVQPVVSAFEPYAQSKRIKLDLRGDPNLPVVQVDPDKLDKVLCNLLSNACKFTEPGGKIAVRLFGDDQKLHIEVKDTGIGLKAEDLPKIFERFHQVDEGTARRYEGTGIGLALSKELVELMGGGLEVESRPGFGSTFSVTLPLSNEQEQAASSDRSAATQEQIATALRARTAAEALVAEEGGASNARSEMVSPGEGDPEDQLAEQDESRPLLLVVEDNPDMRALVTEICQEQYRVLQAEDGKRGLALVKKHRPSVVVADVMMPLMDGNEMLQRIRAHGPTATTPVILLTAKAGADKRLEGLESGADDYLIKPFESRELLARVGNLVRIQQQKQRLQQLNAELQQEVLRQSTALERARQLSKFVSPDLARTLMDQGKEQQILGPTGQRQHLIVFVLRMRGFERMAAELEPEEMAALVSGYLTEVTELAFKHGATLDRYVRDEVVGFFGAPSSKGEEQDAARCAAMALELWPHLERISQRWTELAGGVPPQPSLVIASGHAIVGLFGAWERLEYTALGAVVDEAQSLARRMAPGQAVCTPGVWQLLGDPSAGQPCGEVALRSRSAPIRLYRLAGGGQQKEKPEEEKPSVKITAPGKLEQGAVVNERYRLLKTLGGPEPGTVFSALDLKLSQEVLVKALTFDHPGAQQAKRSFHKELNLARLISHTSVSRIFDAITWQGTELVFMEQIEGQTLEQRLVEPPHLGVEEGTALLLELCSGLGAIHAAGMVHRALKPSNILLTSRGGLVILELGASGWSPDRQNKTYLAPEQLSGGVPDRRSDIYALGAVARRMFCADDNPASLRPQLPPLLMAVIQRCLCRSPDQRLGSTRDIASLLHGPLDRSARPVVEREAR